MNRALAELADCGMLHRRADGHRPMAPVLVHDLCNWRGVHPVCCVRHVIAPGTEVGNQMG